jgi:hypothetical protein
MEFSASFRRRPARTMTVPNKIVAIPAASSGSASIPVRARPLVTVVAGVDEVPTVLAAAAGAEPPPALAAALELELELLLLVTIMGPAPRESVRPLKMNMFLVRSRPIGEMTSHETTWILALTVRVSVT